MVRGERIWLWLNDSDNQVLLVPKVKWGSWPHINELCIAVRNATLVSVCCCCALPVGPNYHGKLPALFK